jgi:hypothetical protein
MKRLMPSQLLLSNILVLILLGISFNLSLCAQSSKSLKTDSIDLRSSASPQPSIEVSESPVASPTNIDDTAMKLKWFFTTVVYPVIVGGVFLLLIGSIVYVISKGEGFGYVRRITGALLPLLLLTFMLLVNDKGNDPIKSFFLNWNPIIYLVFGILIGIALVELGKHLINTDDDRWGSIYNLFLSLMVVFLLYSIMKGFLDSLIYFLFSMIMAGGLDIVFGTPMELEKKGSSNAQLLHRQREREAREATVSQPLNRPPSEDSAKPQPNILSRMYHKPEKDKS